MTKCSRHSSYSSREDGAVLITVLLIVSVMSILAISLLDDVRFAIRRTTNAGLLAQTGFYALGAEDLARQVIWQSWQINPRKSLLTDLWARREMDFPIDGGRIVGRIRDGGNCFNLNSLIVTEDSGKTQDNAEARKEFEVLLAALDVPAYEAAIVNSSLLDWMDADQNSRTRGAENPYYLGLAHPYRAADGPLSRVEEVRAVRGFEGDAVEALLPLVCALPDDELSILNVNTLETRHAPLLVSLLQDRISVSSAMQIIAARPDGGFETVDEFWRLDLFDGVELSDEVRARVQVRTRYYSVDAQVVWMDNLVTLRSLLVLNENGRIGRVSRRVGDVM